MLTGLLWWSFCNIYKTESLHCTLKTKCICQLYLSKINKNKGKKGHRWQRRGSHIVKSRKILLCGSCDLSGTVIRAWGGGGGSTKTWIGVMEPVVTGLLCSSEGGVWGRSIQTEDWFLEREHLSTLARKPQMPEERKRFLCYEDQEVGQVAEEAGGILVLAGFSGSQT